MTDTVESKPETQKGMPVEILGMYLFIASEFILFLTLLFILFWLRAGHANEWPPAGQPRLPLGVTGLNTVFLLISGYTMFRAFGSVRRDEATRLTKWLMITCILGVVFVTIQGFEWIRLISYGLYASSSLYAAMFYVIIGLHGFHVVVTVIALLYLWVQSTSGSYSSQDHMGVTLGFMFWLFVVFVWPILYVTVYLL